MTELLTTRTEATAPAASHLVSVDHLHWWVGNARHTAHFLCAGLGFHPVAYAGPETGQRDRRSWVVAQGDVRFVVTNPLDGDSEMAEHIRLHGDGVREVAFGVQDLNGAFAALAGRGATVAAPPAAAEDDHGRVLVASVRAYGDTLHTMVDRGAYLGPFMPGYEACEPERRPGRGMGLRSYDHVVANVEEHRLDDWVRWYEQVWGMRQLQHFTEQDITTAYSALRSTVVGNGGAVVLPVNEPAPGLRRSQIQEFLDYYRGPGVQHVALRTDDIIATVAAMQRRGIRFLRVPDTYYDEAPERMAGVQLPWRRLAELGILVDRDAGGYLLQVFTENVASRPTVFLEVIQRQGARGFGEGNFKALFTAIEAEQDRRGNL